jgi:serine/threonine protein kinase
MESTRYGTLRDVLNETISSSNSTLSPQLQLEICRDIVAGLDFLHSNHVVHQDIKSTNVLVFSLSDDPKIKPCAKLCDFGVSFRRKFAQSQTTLSNITTIAPPRGGTLRWMAPEHIQVLLSQFFRMQSIFRLLADYWISRLWLEMSALG